MSSSAKLEDQLRAAILARPDAVLDDESIMNALVAANERAMGANIVDLRGIAMERMAARLDRLEDTHRTVVAAAYDNLAGTSLIHRAVLRLIEPQDFAAFLDCLAHDLPEILRLRSMVLVLETAEPGSAAEVERKAGVLKMTGPGFCAAHTGQRASAPPPAASGPDTSPPGGAPARRVTLRSLTEASPRLYGDAAAEIRSEACLRLDLGAGRLPAMLVLGSEDPLQFSAQQGTDLLAFLAGVFERAMRGWLS